jgi:hypothetical protein
VPTQKPRKNATQTWKSKPARRRGTSGSVARAILNQAPQTTQLNAAGAMRPGGVDTFDPTPLTTVRPAPATGVGDPDRQPGRARSTRAARTRAASRTSRTSRTRSRRRR